MSKRKPEAAAKAPAATQAPVPQGSRPQGIPVQGICAIIGTVICVVLNVATDGKVPGGYAAGVIGGGLGWVVGIGVEKMMATRRYAEFMARYAPK